MSAVWRVRLADQAEQDLVAITMWTVENFGARQAEAYAETLSLAIEALHDGPDVLGCVVRAEIGPGLRTLHVARQGRKGRHFVVFSVSPEQTIDVLRVLHDSMDFSRHLSVVDDRQH